MIQTKNSQEIKLNYYKNINLLKGMPMFMNGYWVEYTQDTVIGQNKFFTLDFKKINENEEITEQFTLMPNVLYTNDLTKVASPNPDTKHYLHKDIFVAIASLPLAQQDIKFAQEMEDTLNYEIVEFGVDEVEDLGPYTIELGDLNFDPVHPDYKPELGDIAMQMELIIKDTLGKTYVHSPATALRSTVVYKYQAHENNLRSRFRINEQSFDNLIKPDQLLNYESVEMQDGDQIQWNGFNIDFQGFKKVDESNPGLKANDVAIKGKLKISKDGESKMLEPTFVVRGKRVFPIRDLWWQKSLYARLSSIDPATGKATFEFSQDIAEEPTAVIEIADNVPRQDIIAIEVIEFPGINLVWTGCILMMAGLGLGMGFRMLKKWA